MRILFDHGTPRPLRNHRPEHTVDTASEMGWSEMSNGDLLDHAEREGYQLLITTDQNMRHQQNIAGRRLAIAVLLSTAWPYIQLRTREIRRAIDGIQPGELTEVPIPSRREE